MNNPLEKLHRASWWGDDSATDVIRKFLLQRLISKHTSESEEAEQTRHYPSAGLHLAQEALYLNVSN